MTMHSVPDDSIDALIAKRLPTWLIHPDVDQLRSLQRAMNREQRLAAQIASHFRRLPAIDSFAIPLLTQTLRQAGIEGPDVRNLYVHIEQSIEVPSASPKLQINRHTYHSRQNLLAAALHNFHVEELTPDLFRKAWLADANGRRLALGFETFARCCRTLDLGGQYQRMLQQLLTPKERPTAPGGSAARAVKAMLEDSVRAQFEAAMRLARLKGEMEDYDFYRTVPLWSPQPLVPLVPGSVVPRQLYLLGKCIRGVVALEQRDVEGGKLNSITLWIPQDPKGPITRHASWSAVYRWLGERLRRSSYRRFFARFISERDRPAFVHALNRASDDASAKDPLQVDGRNLAVDKPLFVHLRELRVNKILDDARVLAVPTGDEDLASRHERIQACTSAGLDVLGLAAFFVPVLGEVMLAVSAVQIAHEVYEGYEDWRIGDRESALSHLFGVAEGVAAGLVIGAVGTAALSTLERTVFVDGLTPICDEFAQVRLGQGSLGAHRLEQPGEMLRHWGGPFEDMPDWQAETLSQVTHLKPDQLRRLLAEGADPLARMHDVSERMLLHTQSPQLRGAQLEAELAARQTPPAADQASLLNTFASLSPRQAAEILENASSTDRARLQSSGRIPLAIAERARWAACDARLDRACLGLHFPAAAGTDSERLALGLIERSAPWSNEAGVEIRDGSVDGPLLASTRVHHGAQVCIIVRTADGYLVPRGQSQLTQSMSLWEALLSNLDTAQKRLLGQVDLNEEQLQQWVAEQAGVDRERCAVILGMTQPGSSAMRPPLRLADGRLGYPLSGRMPGGRQAIRDGLHRLFPLLSEVQMERYLADLLNRRVDLWQHYANLSQTLSRLNQALTLWRDEAGVMASLRRRRVASQLRRCWRRKLFDYAGDFVLEIDGERVGSLPQLPADVDFSHVRRLTLRDMDLTEIDEAFIRRFSQLRELDLQQNRLTEIPPGLERLTHLRVVRLSRNQIVMTHEGSRRLAQLSRLHSLDLSNNPLERAPALANLSRLTQLNLRNTGLQALPELTETLPSAAHLDLRNNRITQLRQDVMDLWHNLQRVSLHDNPLDAASVQAHDRLSLANTGSPRSSIAYTHREVDESVLNQWLGSSTSAERSRRTQLWDELSAETGSQDLFQFLADFVETTDFDQSTEHYQRRMWDMLETAHGNEALRTRLFETAGGERTCDDRLLLIMSQLELSVLVEQALIDGPAEQVEARLLRLHRSLFRLDLVDEIAARHLEYMHTIDMGQIDDIEVRLYYRVMLRQELDLPATPDAMHYAEYAQVSQRELTRAARTVLSTETPETLAASLAQRPFWQRYVRTHYAERFEALIAPFYERLESLEGEAVNSAQWVQHSNQLRQELEAAEQQLIRSLADEAYARTVTQA
ncbi:NEL-type E3 ubiquitin ligase domain-containing protein [Pseudomonas phoenicis]|uniref:NEL-type E3 ubiquitin ligase domain-containing protein n=1 Tax=unclassified Pseudomonas TaxID=196821 RepID=UPI00399FD932